MKALLAILATTYVSTCCATSSAAAVDEGSCLSHLRVLTHSKYASDEAPQLPAVCRKLGPLSLDMHYDEIVKNLGNPDQSSESKSGTTIVYVYPRDINERLANRPVKIPDLHYSLLGLTFSNSKLIAIEVMVDDKAPFPYEFYGHRFGEPIKNIISDIDKYPEWNASKDDASYRPLPLDFSVDPVTRIVNGLFIADKTDDLSTFPGLNLKIDGNTKLVSGFYLK